MKKSCLIILLVLLLSLTACVKVKDLPPPEAESAEETNDTGTPEENAEEAEKASLPQPDYSDGYYLLVDGITLKPGDAYPESLFEETAEPTRTPDCRTNKMSTTYSYDGFTVQAAESENQLTGEITEAFITGIELRDRSASHVFSGIGIGEPIEKMKELYGEDYSEQYGGCVYERGQTVLSVYFNENGEVYFVSYALNEALFQEESEENEKKAEEFISKLGETPEESSGEISFTGIHTRHEYSGVEKYDPEDYDFSSDVKAFDGAGNELPVTYTEYVPQVTREYGVGPVFCVFTAEDAAGQTAVAYQMAYCEEYDEEEALKISEHYASLIDDTEEGLVLLKNIIRKIPFADTYNGFDPVSNCFHWNYGNCYGHNRLLADVLEYLGYETYLMWDTEECHYWVIMQLKDGSWRHLDSTPLELYPEPLGFMTDAERAVVNPNRLWTPGIWPAAN